MNSEEERCITKLRFGHHDRRIERHLENAPESDIGKSAPSSTEHLRHGMGKKYVVKC